MQRLILIAAMAVAVWCLPARADADEAVNPDIRAVISAQIDAFRADDFGRAFGYASPAIRGLFGTPERFGLMVRRGYPMVHRPAELRFLGLREANGRLWQRVMIRNQTGAVHMLEYQMVRGHSGWKINGVRILPPGGAGA